jgi:hypothetical protein
MILNFSNMAFQLLHVYTMVLILTQAGMNIDTGMYAMIKDARERASDASSKCSIESATFGTQ